MSSAPRPIDLPRGQRMIASVTDQLQQLISDSLGVQARIDTDAILQRVTSVIAAEMPVTCVGILLRTDPGTSRIVATDHAHPAVGQHIDQYVASLMRPGVVPTAGLSQHVIEAGAPFFRSKLSHDDFITQIAPQAGTYDVQHPFPIKMDPVSLLMVPMRSGPAIVGTLAVFNWQCAAELTEVDIGWMQSVADRVGLLVDSAQLRNRAIDRIERLVALSDVALAITSSQDLRLTLKLVVERTIATLHVDAADILLADDGDGSFYVAANAGFRSTAATEFRLSTPPDAVKRALLERKPGAQAVIDWMGQQRRWVVAREGFRYYTASPLVVRDHVIGALEIFGRTVLEPDAEWTAFFDAVASQAAIAVDNAGMHNAMHRESQAHQGRRLPAPSLSAREREILRLVVEGASNREVAEQLHLSQNTIKFHIRQLLEKAGVSNRTELATKAVQHAWLS